MGPCGSLGSVRVWVTGASGFVGRRLSARLTAGGHEVRGVDRELEITDAERVARAVARERPDAIVHLAALSSGALAAREPERTARVNYLGTLAVLEAARRGVPRARVVLVTSGEVYGSGAPGARPFRETDALAPRTPYARSKACADLLGAARAERGQDVIRLRPFNHTGPGQTDDFVAPSFARQVTAIAEGRREPRLRVGNLDSVRDFLDVDDVVEAYVRVLEGDVPPGAYNVASGVGVRIGDLLATLVDLAGIAPRIEVDPERLRPTDHAVGDASRLRAVTDWAPRVPWRDTLTRLLDAARSAAA